MRRRGIVRGAVPLVCVILAGFTGCAATPRPPASPLPAVKLKDIKDLMDKGSYLQTIQALDEVRRDRIPIAAADMDSLQKQAEDALSSAFQSAVSAKDYPSALRLLDSAETLGRTGIAGTWTRASLLAGVAAAQAASGDAVLSLLTHLSILSLPSPTEADYAAALQAAADTGNRAVERSVAARMKEHGFAMPDALAADLSATPSFPQMISGTVTILVNKGIKVQNGVGYPDSVIGSGFFVDRRGYIVTNHHVIESEVDPKYEGYSRLYIRLSESPVGEKIPARVVGWDKILDLALIKAEITPSYIFGGYGGESMQPGDRIYAIGSPAGLEKTITSGIVSAMGRRLLQVGDSIQVDVPLNPGNSGGPLLNETGDLIGVVFAGLQQFEGLNFAVPYQWIERALPLLYKGGEAVHPWLGMAVAEGEKGLEVVYAVPDEPAALAGIRAGDLIETVDGQPFTKLAAVQEAVLRHDSPALLRVGMKRGADSFDALVCAGPRPDNPIEIALKRDARDNVLYPLFGMQLDHVGTFLWKGDYIVKRVTPGSVADESGISVDDPLTIQDWKVDTDKGYAILQVVIRKQRAGFLESAIQIASYLETDNFI